MVMEAAICLGTDWRVRRGQARAQILQPEKCSHTGAWIEHCSECCASRSLGLTLQRALSGAEGQAGAFNPSKSFQIKHCSKCRKMQGMEKLHKATKLLRRLERVGEGLRRSTIVWQGNTAQSRFHRIRTRPTRIKAAEGPSAPGLSKSHHRICEAYEVQKKLPFTSACTHDVLLRVWQRL
eukprot:scaffold46500_cov19-Tisochrysis_lutea.AAC.2